MSFSEFETKRCEKLAAQFVERRRPPPHLRVQTDLAFRVRGQSVEIFELRADWHDASTMREYPLAKATYIKIHKSWKVFCMRSDLKWHLYRGASEVASLEEFLDLLDEDPNACFFG
jgi:Protein of unknown function (DUF3024)